MAGDGGRREARARHGEQLQSGTGEHELLEARLRFLSHLVGNSTDLIALQDADRTIRYVNPASERVLGYRPEEVVGRSPLDFLHPDDVERANGRWGEVLGKSGTDLTYSNLRYRHKDGTWRYLESHTNNLLYDPEVQGIVVSMRDVTEQKDLENRLRFYALLVENSLDLILVADPEGVALYVNPRVEQVLGYGRDEFLGMRVPDLLHADDFETIMAELAAAASHPGSVSGYAQGRYRHKDGSWVWIEGIAVSLLDDPVVGGIICCGRDITERKRLEDRLRFHSLLVQNVTDIVGVIGPDLTMRYISPSVEVILGYRPRELVGTNNDSHVHPDDLENVRVALTKAFDDSGPTPVVRYRFRHKDGLWVWIEATGTNLLDDPAVGGILFVARDVTERVESEAEILRLNETLEQRVENRTAQLEALVTKLESQGRMLRESEEMFRTTFEAAAVGMAHVSPDGRFLRVNRKLCEIVGYSPEELVGETFRSITHSDDLETDLEQLRRMLDGDLEAYSTEKRYVRKDYSQVWVSLSSSLVRNWADEPDYFITVVEDITERKRAESLRRSLTPRETQILHLLASGRTNREIAQQLNFSVSTVKNHVQNILVRLDATDRTQAAVRAAELGLIEQWD